METVGSIAARSGRIRERIERLPDLKWVVVAVGATQKLMGSYLSRPHEQQSEFVRSWADVVPLLSQAILEPSEEMTNRIASTLNVYYCGPHIHETDEDAVPGADEDAASAAIYAAEAYSQRNPGSAANAALLLLSDAQSRADDISIEKGDSLMSSEADFRRAQFQTAELDLLDSMIAVVEQNVVSAGMLERIRNLLTPMPK